MKYVLNNSKAGKDAQKFLKESFKKNQKQISNKENELKKEESDLLSKKTILTKEEYKKKSDTLRKKVAAYQTDRRGAVDKIAKKRAELKKELITKLNPIVKTYIDENNISIVLYKKNVVYAESDLDITKIIVEKLNKKLPSLNLK